MMAHHERCGPQEIFVGNTDREGGSLERLESRLRTVRLGEVAYCIEGKPLPPEFAPLFIHRSEEGLYDAVMMEMTFGPRWRRT